ncbi:C13 family peptidase [Prosthecobacter sp.]|uniref:C13 family peptidase n=1 Tax=Prosthecobacter sp. TaxID=1965333 RepID=UPI003782FD87
MRKKVVQSFSSFWSGIRFATPCLNELKLWTTLGFALLAPLLHAAPREMDVVLVVGAAGTEEYGKKFQTQVEAWKKACTKGAVPMEVIAGNETTAKLEQRLAAAKPERSLWLVLIGHGTFDGREAMFSAEGPDFDAKQLAAWIKPLKQEVAVIHTASSSGGFLKALSGKKRVIITSTKSPDEVFYARFGEYFAVAIGGKDEADLDQDKQVSLLEAFRHASKATATFYENEGRLATEHALIEDNGDGVGTRSEVFGAEPSATAGMSVDGERAAQMVLVLSEEEQKLTDAQRSTRDALESELKKLKEQRAKMNEDEYYTKLETLMRKLGEVYETKS